MRYGDTLEQRSVPEWVHYNIDYDYLKGMIKHHTDMGTSNDVSTSDKGGTTKDTFGNVFIRLLEVQHNRINLFIKSKSGEIEQRLDFIYKELLHLRIYQGPTHQNGWSPTYMNTKQASITVSLMRAGRDIQSLSRFTIAQCTSFYKLLEKYQRQTKDQDVKRKFYAMVIERPNSIFQLNLTYHLNYYVDVLHTVRTTFQVREDYTTSSPSGVAMGLWTDSTDITGRNRSSSAALLSKATDASDIDFDIAFSTVPLGSQGERLVYWIHEDHLIETLVFLLHYLRPKDPSTATDFSYANSARLDSLAKSGTSCGLSNEDNMGYIVLGHSDSYTRKPNGRSIDANEDFISALYKKTAATARWCSATEAAVVAIPESKQGAYDFEHVNIAKLKRKHLEGFLGISSCGGSRGKRDTAESVSNIRRWITENEHITPLVSVYGKRTRMTGLCNTMHSGVWATLDRDILMKETASGDLENDNWPSKIRVNSHDFPHAILEVRRDGNQYAELVQALDHSHLVERIHGFSLEAHAVWTCCNYKAMSAPLWLPLLDKDIRKLPTPVKRHRRKQSITSEFNSTSMAATRASPLIPSAEGEIFSRNPQNMDLFATLGTDVPNPPPLWEFSKRLRRSHYRHASSGDDLEAYHGQHYWNEYDVLEPGSEQKYHIFVEPNGEKATIRDGIAERVRRTKKIPSVSKTTDDMPPFSVAEISPNIGNETTNEFLHSNLQNYGTMDSYTQFLAPKQVGYARSLLPLPGDYCRNIEKCCVTILSLCFICFVIAAVIGIILSLK